MLKKNNNKTKQTNKLLEPFFLTLDILTCRFQAILYPSSFQTFGLFEPSWFKIVFLESNWFIWHWPITTFCSTSSSTWLAKNQPRMLWKHFVYNRASCKQTPLEITGLTAVHTGMQLPSNADGLTAHHTIFNPQRKIVCIAWRAIRMSPKEGGKS